MLRRRILASAMASVMAIGSVAVVASAEDAAVATTQAKTKADLEAYAKGFESFISTKLDDYGSVSGENFLNAFEYAQNVLADSKSTLDDYTVAYSMLEATYNKLKIYTVEELKALLNSAKATYETNNIYNEELDDLRYTPGSWGKFEEAYDDADAVIGSSDSRIITDAYETLEAAVNNLSALANVTKSQFRTTLKEYETILQKEYAYDSWRVGTISGWADIREMFNDKDGVNSGHFGSWGFYGQTVTYGTLYQWANTFSELISEGYKKLDGIKAVNRTSDTDIVTAFKVAQDIVDVYNGFTPDESARGSKATVTKLIGKYQGRLVHDYETTAAEKLYEKVVANVGAANLHNRLGNDYYSKIDKDVPAVAKGADAWYVPKALWHDDDDDAKDVYKDVDAMLSIKTDVTFYLIFDADNNVVDVTTTKPASNVSSKTINRNTEVDLTDYIIINPDNIIDEFSAVDNHNINGINDGDAYGADPETWSGFQNWASNYSYGTNLIAGGLPGGAFGGDYKNSSGVGVSSYANLAVAMDIATTYLGGDKDEIAASAIYDIDTTDSIAAGTAKGSSSEWTMVYRYLKYALSDKYDVAVGTHTKADVEALIDKCYELAELTGDAAIFTVNHKALVDARQDALTWVKAANKDSAYYKDNTVPYKIADSNGKIAGYKVADQVYEILEDYYKALESDYNAFKYSFGEIYNKIADVKAAIDDGDLQGTDALITALEETAYRLSIVQAITVDANDAPIEIDNDAFTTDRFANLFNRVYTYTDPDWGYDIALPNGVVKLPPYRANGEVGSHADLVAAYEALLAEVKAQTEVKTVVGDVNGDGVVNALDAAAILKAVAAGTAIDVAVGDYNADGVVNALDAAAILKAVTQA